jgi:Family of unknown function (DUF5681)
MANSDDFNAVGYRKPPKRTQFTKGQSGNPKGRPKGSQNFSTILAKAGRERVRVTTNGRSRYVTKFEASMLQLTNKAASGDLKAIRELLCWIRSLEDSEQTAHALPVTPENYKVVMASLIERIRRSEDLPSTDGADPITAEPPQKEE